MRRGGGSYMDQRIVELLSAEKGRLARAQLRQHLELPNSEPTGEYWESEQRLVDAQKIERRRGRNGGIYLLEHSEVQETKQSGPDSGYSDQDQKDFKLEQIPF